MIVSHMQKQITIIANEISDIGFAHEKLKLKQQPAMIENKIILV